MVSLISGQDILHCFTNTQDTTYPTERVDEKKDKQSRTWVSSKRKKGEVCDTICSFLFTWGGAIASVYPSEIPTQTTGTLTHPLTLANPDSGSTGLSSLPSSYLSLAIAFPWFLLTAFFCSLLWPCLPSSSSGLVGNLARKPQTNAPTSCHKCGICFFY